MNLYQARHLAVLLMREHGLAGWTFAFDHAKRRFGRCSYTRKRITLSRSLTLLNVEEEVRDTILHEIAHALAPGDGHGRRWKAACHRVGAMPRRCYDDKTVLSPPRRVPPIQIGCLRCDWWMDRYRRSRQRYLCAACRCELSYRPKIAVK